MSGLTRGLLFASLAALFLAGCAADGNQARAPQHDTQLACGKDAYSAQCKFARSLDGDFWFTVKGRSR